MTSTRSSAPSRTTPPATPAPLGHVAPTRPSPARRLGGLLRAVFTGTPGTMRALGIVGVVACLLFGVLAFLGTQARHGAIGDARAAADQMVRIQSVQNNLVLADAHLTGGFLRGGIEQPADRIGFSTGMTAAATGIAAAASADHRDAAALGRVNDVLQQYAGLVEGARANNRQGFPVGTAYLRQASNLLRDQALPALDTLSQTEQQGVTSAYDASARATAWLVASLIGCVVLLLGVLGYLAVRTRRLVNLPIAAAAVVVIVAGAVGIGIMALAQSKANDARNGAYLDTVRAAVVRTDGFDAHSAEALALINRGNGDAYYARYDALTANATPVAAALAGSGDTGPQEALAKLVALHRTIRTDDQNGNWDNAVAVATGTEARSAFTAFDTASASSLARHAGNLRDGLGSAARPLLPMGIALLVAGALAAAACWWGVSIRLREYQ